MPANRSLKKGAKFWTHSRAAGAKGVPNAEEIIQRHREYAAATSRKDARVNVRLTSRDLRALQKSALAEGIPCQTLISSILHKYAAGRLRDLT